MFDIGFSELLLVALVALLVLGPERLPGAARTAGLWIGRLRRSFAALRSEVEREIGADEIRRQLHNENILAMERQQQAATGQDSPAAAAPPGASPAPGATAMPPASATAEVPIAADSRLNALPGQPPRTPADAAPSRPDAAPAPSAGQPAASTEPPRPT